MRGFTSALEVGGGWGEEGGWVGVGRRVGGGAIRDWICIRIWIWRIISFICVHVSYLFIVLKESVDSSLVCVRFVSILHVCVW